MGGCDGCRRLLRVGCTEKPSRGCKRPTEIVFTTLFPGFYRSTEPRDLVTGRIWKIVGAMVRVKDFLVFSRSGARPVLLVGMVPRNRYGLNKVRESEREAGIHGGGGGGAGVRIDLAASNSQYNNNNNPSLLTEPQRRSKFICAELVHLPFG